MGLKAGHVGDFGGSLAEAIEAAMAAEWQLVKGVPMPEVDPTDRRILFVAIARGLLTYLESRQNQAIGAITFVDGDGDTFTRNVTNVEFTTEL